MLTLFIDSVRIKTNYMKFSDGAITYKPDLPKEPKEVHISVLPTTPVCDVREEINMMVSCLENFYGNCLKELNFNKWLHIPYLPYARADRVFEEGNPSPLFDFLNWLYCLGFDSIHTCDVHNETTLNGYNVRNTSQLDCYRDSLPFDFNTKYDYVVAPDKGSMSKAATIADWFGWETGCIYASKKRDTSTGRIIETTVPEEFDLTGCKVLIPDDILDGGGTFIALAEKLKERGATQVDLYVTHLIGAKGLPPLKGKIDNLYYYQIIGTYVNGEDVLNFNKGYYLR